MNNPARILHIAIPNTKQDYFDYLALDEPQDYFVSQRVTCRFRNKSVIGVVVDISAHSSVPTNKLKPIDDVIDQEPLLSDAVMSLCLWVGNYYQATINEVLFTALPKHLRSGKPARFPTVTTWYINPHVSATLKTEKQKLVYQILQQRDGLTTTELAQLNVSKAVLTRMEDNQYLLTREQARPPQYGLSEPKTAPTLTDEQSAVLSELLCDTINYSANLIHGVTGSGKTEIYIRLAEQVIAQQKQVLLLVPEIGLTPQLLARFTERFTVPIAVMHSGLNDTERFHAWLSASTGYARILIGTRSAVFVPLPDIGMILIDEEHDQSYKQQDGIRYHARDVAMVRAKSANIPIILGSATPSLESLHNVEKNKMHYYALLKRAMSTTLVSYAVIDMRRDSVESGLSPKLITLMKEHLQQGNQVMLFINRRGYAPVLMCHQCAWISDCKRCDAHMTLHYSSHYLQCHHCGYQQRIPTQCPTCKASELIPIGMGTQRLEQTIENLFPQYSCERIDRDTTRRKNAFEKKLDAIHAGEVDILLGTQMLAKGHHFPNVTLVAILDADYGFFSTDFRSAERLGQLLLQVAGRAGRAEKPGTVAIQTHVPQHPLLLQLINDGYMAFAKTLLAEREATHFPPYQHLAIIKVECKQQRRAREFLTEVQQLLHRENVFVLGPVPCPLERKAGVYRYQLLLRSASRPLLQQALKRSLTTIRAQQPSGIKLIIDIDPQDLS